MHKPSTLWPPPGNAESKEVRQGIRDCLRSVAGLSDQDQVVDAGRQVDFDASALTASAVDGQDQRIVLEVEAGKPLVVDSQIQFYAPNNLLPHPLVSPCRAYLGGLPPLLFTAGDQEVLRDEIIYTCVLSLHCSIPVLTRILGLTEQQTRPSSRPLLNPNACIPRSGRSRQNTPPQRTSISKFTMGVRTTYPTSSRSPLPRNIVSERSPVFVDSRLGCSLSVMDHLA